MGKRIALACLLTGLLACGDDDGMEMPDAAVGLDAPECSADPDCDDGVFCNGAETCSAGACVAGEAPCMADQSCDEDMDRCVTPCDVADADGDGVDAPECGGADCDDADPNRFPGNVEVCDAEGHDEDCDPETLGPDRDGDGFVSALCCNGETCGEDCDDFRRYIAPGAPELCDLLDGDCDGSVDEGVAVRGFVDADGDRRGDPEQPIRGCPAADDFAFLGDDCDDTDPSTPGEELIGDEADNDCDGRVDEAETGVRTLWPDEDGDGYGDPEGLTLEGSVAVEGYVPVSGDCDDDDPMVHPGAPERCNGLDDDCDGAADFRIGEGDGEDDDRDGFPDAACDPEGEADCDDRNPDVHPGAEEVCDGVDNDCDASTPAEDACQTVTWYVDADGDGWGDDAGSGMSSDVPLEGYARRAGDCDDEDPSKRPDAYEDCNAEDDDCDGVIDERADRVCGGTNALGACVAGTCERLVCARGYDDCDDTPLDCETPLDGLANCGACGNVCRSGPNTVPACVDQECRFECAPGFGDCNDDLAVDGCEANLMTDEANCGRCTAACRDGADATATCDMGRCEYACAPGWSDCDMDLGEASSNFCETRTSRDPLACGDCATSCDAGAPLCVEGSCQGWSFASDGSDGAFAFVPDVVDGTVMTLPSGVHAFDGDVVIPAGTTLRTSGSGVLEIYATGAIRVEGTVDVSGGDGASAGGSDVSYWDCGAGGETGTGVAGVRGGGVAGGGVTLPGESRGVSARCGRGGRFGGGGGGDSGERAGAGGGGGPGGGGGGGGFYTDGGAGGGGALGGAQVDVGDTAGQGGPGTGAYAGGSGGVRAQGGGGGGSIGPDAEADLPVDATFAPGSGGGGGGSSLRAPGGGGGGGGGAVRLSSPERIEVPGAVLANGGAGGGGFTCGGGGSGGVVYLAAPAVSVSGEVAAEGGAGARSGCFDGIGGDGGLGRIRLSVYPDQCSLPGVLVPATSCAPSDPMSPTPERGYVGVFPD